MQRTNLPSTRTAAQMVTATVITAIMIGSGCAPSTPNMPIEPSAPARTVVDPVPGGSIDLTSRFADEPAADDRGSFSGAECELVDIRGDRRRAVRLGPNTSRALTIATPAAARFRFSVSSMGDPSSFEVAVTSPAADPITWARDLPGKEKWIDVDLPLGGLPGAEVQITASAGAGGVVFAIPRLVGGTVHSDGKRQPSVVIYLIDTLRADHISAYGYSRTTTPFLDEIAVYIYENSYSTAAWTRPSTASILTGLFPSFHQANAKMSLPLEVTTIAETLRAAGWSTWAFVSNGNVGAVGLNFDQGFDRFVLIPKRGSQPDAVEINEEVLPWIEKVGDEPFFMFLHSVDPHAPYNAPRGYRNRFTDPSYDGPVLPEETSKKFLRERDPSPADLEYIRALYDEEIFYQDRMIQDLYERLDGYGLLENTYSIFTSDHGEEFFEHGYWEHGKRLYEEQIRVPLIVIPPRSDEATPRRISARVQGVDLVPSILNWLGVEHNPGASHGSILPVADSPDRPARPIYCQEFRNDSGFDLYSLMQGPSKIIAKINQEKRRRKIWIFDLAADPGELKNLYSTLSKDDHELVQQLEDYGRTRLSGEPAHPVAEPILDKDTLDQLRAFGYIE